MTRAGITCMQPQAADLSVTILGTGNNKLSPAISKIHITNGQKGHTHIIIVMCSGRENPWDIPGTRHEQEDKLSLG